MLSIIFRHSQNGQTNVARPSDIGLSLLDASHRKPLLKLVIKYNDVSLYDVRLSELGRTDQVQHKFRLTDSTPVYQCPYKVAESQRLGKGLMSTSRVCFNMK